MTVHLSGSDLAAVYAAALAGRSQGPMALQDASDAVEHFIETVTRLSGEPPHIGDPFVWEREPDGIPERLIRDAS